MERVFAKYEKIKNLFEGYIESKNGKVRKLFSQGAIHIFDAENPQEEDSSPGHRLNIGVYENPGLVHDSNSLNTIFFDHRLPLEILDQQINLFIGEKSGILDIAFSLNQNKYDELKSNLKELRNLEQVLEKIHYEHVPLRKYQFNNLKFYSKYLVGESVGGDYFDIEELNNHVYFFLASFNSYVSSVNFIKNVSVIKNSGKEIFDKVSKYVEEIEDEIKSVIFFEINPRTLKSRYLCRGDGLIYANGGMSLGPDNEYSFKPGEKVFVGSSGFKSLMHDYKYDIDNVFRSENSVSDVYNNFFSFLNDKKTGRFLPCDSTLISIFINEKFIQEVKDND